MRHHNGIFLQCRPAFRQNAGKYQKFHRPGEIFDGRKGHQCVGLGSHHFVLYDGTQDRHVLVVKLFGIVPLQLCDGTGGNALSQSPADGRTDTVPKPLFPF